MIYWIGGLFCFGFVSILTKKFCFTTKKKQYQYKSVSLNGTNLANIIKNLEQKV